MRRRIFRWLGGWRGVELGAIAGVSVTAIGSCLIACFYAMQERPGWAVAYIVLGYASALLVRVMTRR